MDPKDNDPSARAKRKRLREAKSGKRDLIEDILSTEELAGTYEARDKMAKMLEAEKRWVKEYHRKRAEVLQKKQQDQINEANRFKAENINRYIEFILYNTLDEEAWEFMCKLRLENQDLCHKLVRWFLIPPEEELNKLVQLILKYGPQRAIGKISLLKMIYKIRGYEQKIERGEKGGKRTEIL